MWRVHSKRQIPRFSETTVSTRFGSRSLKPRIPGHIWLALIGLLTVLACSHSGERDELLGYWEGTIPLPATGELVPISYDFRDDGLTVAVGLGENRTETSWVRWQIHSEDRGDIILHIYRDDERVLSTLARRVSDEELMLWDPGTDESTAAHVRRAQEQR